MIVEVSHFLSIISTGLFFLVGCFSLTIKNNSYVTSLISRTYSHAFLFLFISFLIYVWLAATDNFSVQYIYNHSNSDLPVFYKISSIWSAHEGSMFLWIFFLSVWGFIFNIAIKNNQILKPKTIGIISLILVGFLLFLLITSNPFTTILPIAPLNGADINPVLQDPALAIHPPTLYLGYVGFVIPFACSIAFLINGDPDVKWEKLVRKWSVSAWVFLTVGITLGSWWAYYELGWGGYWFWDPVENVALMPWLAATALLHSLSVSIKSSQLRTWTILLSITVFSLSLFGAFIVRSGIIDSVHSFANDPQRGLYLLAFISVIVLSSLCLFISRFSIIKNLSNIKIFSKESFISINNIFFGTLTFSIMLGVVYPLIYEYLFDQKISVGAPFYNAIFIPIVILASLFLFFSIDSKWSRNIGLKIFTKPIGLSLLLSVSVTTIIFFYFEISKTFILLSVFTGLLVIFRYLIEIWFSLFYKKYLNPFSAIAHLALGLLLVSISLNSLLSTERALNIKINEFENYKDLKIYFNDLRVNKGSNYDAIRAEFYIEDNIQINFLIRWIWFSAFLMAFAGIILISSRRRT